MGNNREPLSKTLRFEVFKRDKFTCQYCGRMAPDVILEIDHIKPVKDGGKSDILNLVTSCRDCNRGKGARKICEHKELKLQQQELKDLAERREQLEFLVQWKAELDQLAEIQIDLVEKEIKRYTDEYRMSKTGRLKMRKLIDQFGLNDVIVATNIAYERYYLHSNKPWRRDESLWIDAFRKIGGICYNRKYRSTEDK